MAIILEANYAKKLGLPNFSSHQYSVTIRAELNDLNQVDVEASRLYGLLQTAVDREIQEVGFMPDASLYGMNRSQNGNDSTPHNGAATPSTNGHVVTTGTVTNSAAWNCTEGQKGFVLRIISDNRLDKHEVDRLAHELYGVGVRDLDKMQASQLIEELLEKVGKKSGARRAPSRGRQTSRS